MKWGTISTSFCPSSLQKKAKDLYNKICEHGNPFAINHESLLKLDTQEIFDPTVEQTIRNLESKGTEQYNQFVSERLETGNKSIHDVLPKNSNPLMSTLLKKLKCKCRQQVESNEIE